MKPDPRDESYEEMQRKVWAALQQLTLLVGPRECPLCEREYAEHDFGDCGDIQWKDCVPQTDWLLSEFVLLTTWTNMADGHAISLRHNHFRAQRSHVAGLLTMHLDES